MSVSLVKKLEEYLAKPLDKAAQDKLKSVLDGILKKDPADFQTFHGHLKDKKNSSPIWTPQEIAALQETDAKDLFKRVAEQRVKMALMDSEQKYLDAFSKTTDDNVRRQVLETVYPDIKNIQFDKHKWDATSNSLFDKQELRSLAGVVDEEKILRGIEASEVDKLLNVLSASEKEFADDNKNSGLTEDRLKSIYAEAQSRALFRYFDIKLQQQDEKTRINWSNNLESAKAALSFSNGLYQELIGAKPQRKAELEFRIRKALVEGRLATANAPTLANIADTTTSDELSVVLARLFPDETMDFKAIAEDATLAKEYKENSAKKALLTFLAQCDDKDTLYRLANSDAKQPLVKTLQADLDKFRLGKNAAALFSDNALSSSISNFAQIRLRLLEKIAELPNDRVNNVAAVKKLINIVPPKITPGVRPTEEIPTFTSELAKYLNLSREQSHQFTTDFDFNVTRRQLLMANLEQEIPTANGEWKNLLGDDANIQTALNNLGYTDKSLINVLKDEDYQQLRAFTAKATVLNKQYSAAELKDIFNKNAIADIDNHLASIPQEQKNAIDEHLFKQFIEKASTDLLPALAAFAKTESASAAKAVLTSNNINRNENVWLTPANLDSLRTYAAKKALDIQMQEVFKGEKRPALLAIINTLDTEDRAELAADKSKLRQLAQAANVADVNKIFPVFDLDLEPLIAENERAQNKQKIQNPLIAKMAGMLSKDLSDVDVKAINQALETHKDYNAFKADTTLYPVLTKSLLNELNASDTATNRTIQEQVRAYFALLGVPELNLANLMSQVTATTTPDMLKNVKELDSFVTKFKPTSAFITKLFNTKGTNNETQAQWQQIKELCETRLAESYKEQRDWNGDLSVQLLGVSGLEKKVIKFLMTLPKSKKVELGSQLPDNFIKILEDAKDRQEFIKKISPHITDDELKESVQNYLSEAFFKKLKLVARQEKYANTNAEDLPALLKTNNSGIMNAFMSLFKEKTMTLKDVGDIVNVISMEDSAYKAIKKIASAENWDYLDPVFEGLAKKHALEMAPYLERVNKMCERVLLNLRVQRQAIEDELKALSLPDTDANRKKNVILDEQRKLLRNAAQKIDTEIKLYTLAEKRLKGDKNAQEPHLKDGILKRAKEAEKAEKFVLFRMFSCKVSPCGNTEKERADFLKKYVSPNSPNAPKDGSSLLDIKYSPDKMAQKPYKAKDKALEGKATMFVAEHASEQNPGTTVKSCFAVTRSAQDLKAKTEDGTTHYEPSIKAQLLQAPDSEEAMVEVVLNMASQIVAGLTKQPTALRPITIGPKGKDEYKKMLWVATHELMKLHFPGYDVNCIQFRGGSPLNPDDEFGNFYGYKSGSTYDTYFKDHPKLKELKKDYQQFLDDREKAIDAQKTMAKTTVQVFEMFKDKFVSNKNQQQNQPGTDPSQSPNPGPGRGP